MTGTRPRIAILADWWWPDTVGGAERSSRTAAMRLAEFGTVRVFVPATRDREYPDGPLTVHAVRRPFARRTHPDTVARRGLEFLSAWLLPPVAWRLGRALRRFDPDVTVATNISRTGPWLVRRAGRGRAAIVRTYHDLSDTCWRRSRLRAGVVCTAPCGQCQVKTRLMRAATPASATAVCVSGFVRDELVRAGLTTVDRSTVGYPLTALPSRPIARLATDRGLVLGYLGRLDPVKGVDAAIRTGAEYRRLTGTPVSMVVAGEGNDGYRQRLVALAAAESLDVQFPGRMDVDDFCALVDVALVPSRWMEAFGRVVVEIAGRGRPMLIAPVGGLPEAAEISGGRYVFADFQDPPAAARALRELLSGKATGSAPVAAAATLAGAVESAVRRALGEPAQVRS